MTGPLALGLRRDLVGVEARIREADGRGDDRTAFARTIEAEAIRAEIADAEGVSLIGLLTETMPREEIA